MFRFSHTTDRNRHEDLIKMNIFSTFITFYFFLR